MRFPGWPPVCGKCSMTGPGSVHQVDHIIFGAPDLGSGVDHIEGLLGVRPAMGGRHPVWGTRNALLSIGPQTYLEVMAPDPELPRPELGVLFDLDQLAEPRLVTWVLRSEEIDALSARAAQAGLGLGSVDSGYRDLPDGKRLTWRLSDPRAMPMGGAVPLLISWGDTPHPSATAPLAGRLEDLRIEHPEPDRVRAALDGLGVTLTVEPGGVFQLIASVRTQSGIAQIR